MRQRPYKSVRHHAGYVARATRYPVGAIRPSRNAAGMTYTASRGGGPMSDDARRLSLFGTLDRISLRGSFLLTTKPCVCCGQKTGKLALSDAGRRRLQARRIV